MLQKKKKKRRLYKTVKLTKIVAKNSLSLSLSPTTTSISPAQNRISQTPPSLVDRKSCTEKDQNQNLLAKENYLEKREEKREKKLKPGHKTSSG